MFCEREWKRSIDRGISDYAIAQYERERLAKEYERDYNKEDEMTWFTRFYEQADPNSWDSDLDQSTDFDKSLARLKVTAAQTDFRVEMNVTLQLHEPYKGDPRWARIAPPPAFCT